jgi:nicotinamidase-related amidase
VPPWDRYLTDRDRIVFPRSGHGKRAGLGERPALVIVDVTYGFVGDRPEPILDSLERWPLSSGEEGWQAVESIRTLLGAVRELAIPVVYTTPVERQRSSRWAEKNSRRLESESREDRNTIVPAIAPRPEDIVIRKEKASGFFGTPLAARLIELGVDSLLVTGGTTSGCVRATVVDGFSYNFRVAVVEECVFDRGQASHALSLFDMQQKYADVISLDEALRYCEATGRGSAGSEPYVDARAPSTLRALPS